MAACRGRTFTSTPRVKSPCAPGPRAAIRDSWGRRRRSRSTAPESSWSSTTPTTLRTCRSRSTSRPRPTTAGDFRVVWQDDRIFSHSGWNTWYKRTTNGGTSWAADVRISDLTSGAPYKSVNGYAFPYGDYGEIDVDSNGRNYVVWGEGASYTGPGGTWYTRGN